MYNPRVMILQERRQDIKPIRIMQISQLLRQGCILSRPSYQSPLLVSPMLTKNVNRKVRFEFVSRVEVVIVIVDVNGQKLAILPYFDGEEEHSGVVLLIRKDLIEEFVC